jgi:hypothetical protein
MVQWPDGQRNVQLSPGLHSKWFPFTGGLSRGIGLGFRTGLPGEGRGMGRRGATRSGTRTGAILPLRLLHTAPDLQERRHLPPSQPQVQLDPDAQVWRHLPPPQPKLQDAPAAHF